MQSLADMEESRVAAEMWRLNDLRNKEQKKLMFNWQVKQSIVAIVLGVVLTALSYAIANIVGWDVTFNWLDATAVGASYACVWLSVVQSRLNYLIGIVGVALYSMLFFRDGYNALAWFNLYLVGSLAFGWFRWGKDLKPKLVTSLGLDKWTVGYASIGFIIAAVCMLINMVYPETFRTIDIAITALSGVAQFLMDNKRLQTWQVWLMVNLLSIYAFIDTANTLGYSGLYIVALQYVFFTINTLIGYISWKRSIA